MKRVRQEVREVFFLTAKWKLAAWWVKRDKEERERRRETGRQTDKIAFYLSFKVPPHRSLTNDSSIVIDSFTSWCHRSILLPFPPRTAALENKRLGMERLEKTRKLLSRAWLRQPLRDPSLPPSRCDFYWGITLCLHECLTINSLPSLSPSPRPFENCTQASRPKFFNPRAGRERHR